MATNWAHCRPAPALRRQGPHIAGQLEGRHPSGLGRCRSRGMGTRRPRVAARPGRPARHGAKRASRGGSPSPLARPDVTARLPCGQHHRTDRGAPRTPRWSTPPPRRASTADSRGLASPRSASPGSPAVSNRPGPTSSSVLTGGEGASGRAQRWVALMSARRARSGRNRRGLRPGLAGREPYACRWARRRRCTCVLSA
jgi:hypothetical protein